MDAELEKRLCRIEQISLLGAKNVLSIKEAAMLLGRSEKTIRNRLDEIPHYYGGTGLVFKRKELEEWQCKVQCKPVSQLINN